MRSAVDPHRFPCQEVDHRGGRDGEILQLAEPVRRRCWRLNASVQPGSSHAFAIDTGLVRVIPNGDCEANDLIGGILCFADLRDVGRASMRIA
jgi:hypothetical protein